MKTFIQTVAMRSGTIAALMFVLGAAFAGPGAHGPGGEHLDAPGSHAANTTTRPRIEAKSELFELVGYLGGGELSVMINRFETNEPLLDARVEVAMGASKATAKFHADHGDYAIDDAAFLKQLSVAGEHPLIFTIVAGNDSDLLAGTLTVASAQTEPQAGEHSHALDYALTAAAALVLVIAVVVLWRRRARRRTRYAAAGELS